MPELSNEEKETIQENFNSDLTELVEAWRTVKKGGVILAKLFAFLLLLASLLVAIKELKK